jgi:hypothetical protein
MSDDRATPADQTSAPATAERLGWLSGATTIVALAAVLVVAWSLATEWSAIVHAHPAYPALLVLTLVGAVIVLVRQWRPRPSSHGWRRALRVFAVVAAVGWIALMAWLRPFSAQEPAIAAMASDSRVTVVEYPTQIVMTPTGTASSTGVFFQPGAKVDARAYAAVLRPLAEAGHVVVIPKQPLSIAFLAITAFATTTPDYPGVTRWVVGGHSLGGTVAAIDANSHDHDATAPVVGLLLYASYPATDMSTTLSAQVLSISGSNDGLATPAKIQAAKPLLPPSTTYDVIDGAVHAYFGDYGPQPGDGTPTITHDQARTQISDASSQFLTKLTR